MIEIIFYIIGYILSYLLARGWWTRRYGSWSNQSRLFFLALSFLSWCTVGAMIIIIILKPMDDDNYYNDDNKPSW